MSGQRHDIAGGMSRHVTCIEIGIAMQGLDNAMANVTRGRHRRQADSVDDATHATDVSNGLLRVRRWNSHIVSPVNVT